jgi:hypothetical protein
MSQANDGVHRVAAGDFQFCFPGARNSGAMLCYAAVRRMSDEEDRCVFVARKVRGS